MRYFGQGRVEICEVCGMPWPLARMFEGSVQGFYGRLICDRHGAWTRNKSYQDHQADWVDIPDEYTTLEPPFGMAPWWSSGVDSEEK